MFKKKLVLIFTIALICFKMNAQEGSIRFFDLETKPTISVLYDQTHKRKVKPIFIPNNIYNPLAQRRNINIAKQVEKKENEISYLAQIYQSRINQQQNRISQSNKSNLKTRLDKDDEVRFQLRDTYNYQPYGWENNYYNRSRQWQPTFYQNATYGRFRANRYLSY
ncbi:hypothetical protein GCM10010831_10920 [Psychroflexus salis]|uniref:Uncharacterized protein n=2 Tax=Psychroflexus salis TaxID=1526574 RepID=A0A916ZS05_9FLAO|nr:hypothetical protein GCM10010831_10920 [Psychroflexus salis]